MSEENVAIDSENEEDVTINSENEEQGPYLITEEILRKRLEKQTTGRYITQFYSFITANIGAVSFGMFWGWSSPMLRDVAIGYFSFPDENDSWIACLGPLGCSCGVISWSYFMKKLGAKRTMLIQSTVNIICWLLLAFVNSLKLLMFARFVCGFFSVAYIVCGENLLVDSVHYKNLKHMMVFFRSSLLLGVYIVYVLGFKVQYPYISSVCAGISGLHLLFLCFQPESPVYLYNISEKKAERSLKWYQGKRNVATRMRSIKNHAEGRRLDAVSYKYMLYAKVVLKALLIVLGLFSLRVLSGYSIFIFFCSEHWYKSYHGVDVVTNALVYGAFMYFSSFLGIILTFRESFGVRKPLFISCFLVAFQLTILSIYLYLYEHDYQIAHRNNWFPLVVVTCFIICYELGLSVHPDIILSEYVPHQVYKTAKMIARIVHWLLVFALVKSYISVRQAFTTYFFFGGLAMILYIGIFYCYFFVIESTGKNLVQIQNEIGGNPIGRRTIYQHKREIFMTLPEP